MHPYHEELLAELEKYVTENHVPLEPDGFRYIGTTKPVYFVRAADLRKMYKGFIRRHPDLILTELVALLDSLSLGKTNNEFAAIGLLLELYPQLRRKLDPAYLDRWLERAEGWAEVDVICQLNFTADEMLLNWESWRSLLECFCVSENIHKRRASLVLLVKPLRESDDARLAQLAFENVDKLKAEKAILITKAVSWILRSLIKYHRSEVEQYLDTNVDILPKIALRETRNKLANGVKKKMPDQATVLA